jgi:SAM-dependent methyltransferase
LVRHSKPRPSGFARTKPGGRTRSFAPRLNPDTSLDCGGPDLEVRRRRGRLPHSYVWDTRLEAILRNSCVVGFVLGSMLLFPLRGQEAARAPKRGPDVPFVATTNEAVAAILKIADVGKKDIVYDLGSGDGRIPIAAAKQRGARGVGIDIDPALVVRARENAKAAGVSKRVRFVEADLFGADIHDATVVVLFLAPELNLQLLPKLLRELKPGTRIVSNTFEIYGWTPDREATVGNPDETRHPFSHKLYLWKVPADRKIPNR